MFFSSLRRCSSPTAIVLAAGLTALGVVALLYPRLTALDVPPGGARPADRAVAAPAPSTVVPPAGPSCADLLARLAAEMAGTSPPSSPAGDASVTGSSPPDALLDALDDLAAGQVRGPVPGAARQVIEDEVAARCGAPP